VRGRGTLGRKVGRMCDVNGLMGLAAGNKRKK
jgi:hypothetical protein